MCCDPKEARGRMECCENVTVCCEPRSSFRRFRSSKEEAERLEAYKEELEKEIAGVTGRIQELKRK
jgi:hypothetical protein